MKIAVSSQNKTTLTGHLGRCQTFWIYDVEGTTIQDKQLLQITKDQSFRESSPKDPHPLDAMQVLISGGIGRGLARRLEVKGIQPLITAETDLDAAVMAYVSGTLAVMTPEEHHQLEHGDDHEHHHGAHNHGRHKTSPAPSIHQG
ncbi:NifB/NifX family molybdenum-iron cluster-binding protein [Leptolyngbya sp. CCNP1308]|uniref:NifB/NifX family molybdenum-iron cluster-binding protein n=1 Tax=Leptolyngbya sp. CCNP1308 TaxID=3110255 RepID=UPI002B1EC7DF|nr:NifB/NifX family molybdenum-iron cluster-binding protein [Leptolyngbya sp. CCNP1308]MEA5451892.1 NifB/NifX family molybdenum-iron cluster-binding protein [Leptolyngbya sp. CCNP1308]